MKNFLKYTAVGFVVIMLVAILGPMIGGFLLGAAIAIFGVWGYQRSQSFIMKLLNITIVAAGVMFAIGSVPFLLVLAAPVVGYYTYKVCKDGNFKLKEQDPFDNFEVEWNKLTK